MPCAGSIAMWIHLFKAGPVLRQNLTYRPGQASAASTYMLIARPQFPACRSPNRSQVLPLKRMNCIWSTGT